MREQVTVVEIIVVNSGKWVKILGANTVHVDVCFYSRTLLVPLP